jgi:hypothetical protein
MAVGTTVMNKTKAIINKIICPLDFFIGMQARHKIIEFMV